MIAQRITTRRARAAGCAQLIDDITIGQTDQGEIVGRGFARVAVVCTLGDIMDPRFRLWLVETLATRMQEPHGITIEIYQ